jgi:hypothetical protein
MNDIEFVSELVALLEYGITEKKDCVDLLYKKDITQQKSDQLQARFIEIIAHFNRFNDIRPIHETRYKQKNDFYSIFAFLRDAPVLSAKTLDYFYKVLVRIGPHISPSNEGCPPLMDYAVNCVTQSNSKKAREARAAFLKALLLNDSTRPNDTQKQILDYFDISHDNVSNRAGFLTLKTSKLPAP